jgi:glucose/arabinose dehydrogenase
MKAFHFLLLFILTIHNSHAQVTLVEAFPGLSFSRPVDLQFAPDNSNRIFVVSQQGQIFSFANDSTINTMHTFLDIRDSVSRVGNEEGLLGLAFHPHYAANGYFYVYYSKNDDRRSIIARYSVSSENPDSAILNSPQIIMDITQPARNHNGGQLAFGADGYLYISLGDGGSGGDPWGPVGNGQNRETLLGSILRINIDDTSHYGNYSIPVDNPFAGNTENFREEIYAYGLRNPWRFSFDPVTRWLWAGDVGQGDYEEIDIIESGQNYGWKIMEGFHCYNTESCNDSGLTYPVWEYDHDTGGISVTGGHVYRGSTVPFLYGKYIYTDYGTSIIWTLEYDGINPAVNQQLFNSGRTIVAFGVDQNYELYACAFNGRIYKFHQALILDKVTLIYPQNNTVLASSQNIVFQWEAVDGASNYNFQLATDSLFLNLLNSYSVTDDSLEIEGLAANIPYFWRVVAADSLQYGGWSETWSFSIDDPLQLAAPQLLSPPNNEMFTGDTILFQWTAVTEAQNYKIEISGQSNFSSVLLDSITSDTLISIPFHSLTAQAYFWHVRALADTIGGPWSETRTFEKSEVVSIKKTDNPLHTFQLKQNFPNPFNPNTVIEYTIALESRVWLTVYNIRGETITTLVKAQQAAGSYSVTFDASAYASGIYFYHLKAGSFSQIKRMLLLK